MPSLATDTRPRQLWAAPVDIPSNSLSHALPRRISIDRHEYEGATRSRRLAEAVAKSGAHLRAVWLIYKAPASSRDIEALCHTIGAPPPPTTHAIGFAIGSIIKLWTSLRDSIDISIGAPVNMYICIYIYRSYGIRILDDRIASVDRIASSIYVRV